MASYPKLVQVTWDVIEQFITEWQRDPYRFLNEFSFQAELYSRIKTVIDLMGYGTIEGKYKKGIVQGYEDLQNWNRVVCEPPVYYKDKQGNQRHCRPDIVIWEDIDNPDSPPDENSWDNWPAIFVCEIKVDAKDDDQNNPDLEKLKILVANRKDVQYACWLNFIFKESDKKGVFRWDDVDKTGNLFKCNIYLPKRENKE